MDQLMDVDEMPPAQDSPQHILNVLNDDCIQSVFHRIKNVRDFLSAAETCVRFQENAKLTFPSNYKSIYIGELHDDEPYNRETITVDRVESFLSLFGNLITDVDFDRRSTDQTVDDNIQNMIADCCGRTMISFKLSSSDVPVNFSTRSPLQALQDLQIYDTNIYNFGYHSQLRKLFVTGMRITHFDWLIQSFKQLEIVKFYVLHEIQNNQVIEFLKLNPQIRCLSIEFCRHITPLIFYNIDTLTPNLEKLSIWIAGNGSSILNDHLLNISNLLMLKCLTIISFSEMPLVKLVDRLIENNVPLEKFAIFGIGSGPQVHQLNVTELKSLKKLCLPQMSDDILIKFVKELPALEFMFTPNSSNITVNGIKCALENGKKLSTLIIDTKNIAIDLDDYNSILKLAKERVRVEIYIENGSFINIPSHLLEANRKWLNVILESSSEILRKIIQEF